jgi:hypothetical protein
MSAPVRLVSVPVLFVVFTAGTARADLGEVYTFATGGPAVLILRGPGSSTSSGTSLGAMPEVGAYRGVTDTLHLGFVARYSTAQNLVINDAIIGPPGAVTHGVLYENPADARGSASRPLPA